MRRHTITCITASFLVMMTIIMGGCDKHEDSISDSQNEVVSPKDSIPEIVNPISELLEACEYGKHIRQINHRTADSTVTTAIIFSDNTKLEFLSTREAGNTSIILHISSDKDNFWKASYDYGQTFKLISGADRKSISAHYTSGYILKPYVTEDGFHAMHKSRRLNTNILESIVTDYKADPHSVISSILEDNELKQTTIWLTDGTALRFEMERTAPQGIVLLDEQISIRHNYTADIRFRLNPSDADIHEREIFLDEIDSDTKSAAYPITASTNLSIESLSQATDKYGKIMHGEYVLTVRDKGLNEMYNDKIAIVISRTSLDGKTVNVSSDVLTVNSDYPSSLPRVYINTPDGIKITSKTEWVEDSNIRIVNADGTENLNATTSIRGRGNSTWGYPKKPYALKLDSKAEVLGMPKHKRWVLLANWMDRTLLRNDVAFEMGRRIMEWAPRGQFVELYINGVHQGNYYLCEQIKVDKNRVDIDDDGYILEFDDYGPSDEINYFYSPVMNYPVTIKEPDEEVITSWEHPVFLYIQNYVGDVERLLDEDQNTLSRWSELQDMLDIRSYIDWWLIHELTGNTEPGHPKSSYMFKKDGGKLYAGPVWDFDWQTFSWRPSGPVVAEFIWYRHLFRYEEFRAAVKERWSQTKDIYIDIDAYISSQAELIRSSNEVNIAKWPITMNVNEDYDDSFDKAISMMRSRYDERIKVIDNYISEF